MSAPRPPSTAMDVAGGRDDPDRWAHQAGSSDGGACGDRAAPPTRRRLAAGLFVVLLAVPAVSYARALAFPGSATWQQRSVGWVRDHGGGPAVDTAENWYYTRHPPSAGPPDPASVPVRPAAPALSSPARSVVGAPRPVPLAALPGAQQLAGEGSWTPGRNAADGFPALYTVFFRPDPALPSVVAGAAWMRADTAAGHLVAGTREPGGSGWPGGARVAARDVPSLLATFNSGFQLKDIPGGFFQGGRTAGRLVDGQASLVIDDEGRFLVGQWGRDVSMNRHVAAVRQNLALVVDAGRPAAGLTSNAGGRWGSAKNQYQYTWRSGVGTDAAGDLLYVGGAGLDLKTLAAAMVQAGVTRGMELDVHPGMASFASWTADLGRPVPVKLLPGMTRPADRYLVPDQRDFFYLTLR